MPHGFHGCAMHPRVHPSAAPHRGWRHGAHRLDPGDCGNGGQSRGTHPAGRGTVDPARQVNGGQRAAI
jgi:hypothetical protein